MPPTSRRTQKEYEEYAHGVHQHVMRYVMSLSRCSYLPESQWRCLMSDFGARKANVAVAMLVATLKAGLVAAIFMHLAAEKTPDLSHPHFHRFSLLLGLFWLIFLGVVRLPDLSLNVA